MGTVDDSDTPKSKLELHEVRRRFLLLSC